MAGAEGALDGRRLGFVLLCVALAALAAAGLSRALMNPDEPREAEIAREMYLAPSMIPTLAGEQFFEKPPLYYLVVAGLFTLTGGPSVWAARLVSALAGLGTLALLFAWGRRVHSDEAGLAAALMLATSAQFFYATHWILIDPLLMLFATLAVIAGWSLVERGPRSAPFAVFYLAVALALWTKGLIGPVLTLGGLFAYFAVRRGERPWRAFRPLAGVPLLAAGVVVLGLAIWLDGGRDALWQWGWVNHVERFTKPQSTGHAQPFYYYLGALPLSVAPWLVPFAALLTPSFWRGGDRLKLYLAAFPAAGFVVLSAAATKREVYLLPLLPPLFLLLGVALAERLRATARGPALAQALVLGLWGALPGAALAFYQRRAGAGAIVAIAFGLLLGAIGLRYAARREVRAAWALSVAGALWAAVTTFALVVPALEPAVDIAPFARVLAARVPAGQPFEVLGADETLRGILPFVTGPRVREAAPAREPRFVVRQAREDEPPPAWLAAGYRSVEERTFGTRRRIALWQRIPARLE